VEVEVRDRVSSEFIPALARGVAQEGGFQDSLQLSGWIPGDPLVPTSYAAAHERAGIYSLHLELDGYQAWDTAGIQVNRDECHVRTVNLAAALQPAP
jgi:hypothetical protein